MKPAAIPLEAIRRALDGLIPASIATCDDQGLPNVALISQVNYLDSDHVALSYQFFNKTRANILVNPIACVQLLDPATGAVYRLTVHYLRTETSGAIFESMKAKLAGIASHAGMQDVFQLLGADVFRVAGIEMVAGKQLPAPIPRYNPLAATRRCAHNLGLGRDLASLLDQLLTDLRDVLAIDHAMILMLDEPAGSLYTIASLGYDISGVGSEIRFGHGVIGVAARERTPIRIMHLTTDYAYGRAVLNSSGQLSPDQMPQRDTSIPFPGLTQPHSQLAVPITHGNRLFGVIFVESEDDLRFGYDDEDALVIIAAQLGVKLDLMQEAGNLADEDFEEDDKRGASDGEAVIIRHYPVDHSIFIDQDYLIKGVAGAIFWKLVNVYVSDKRRDFTNRELRLAPEIRMPENAENLEARLILLQRRMRERCPFLRIEKTGRGRFELQVDRRLSLIEMPDAKDN
jgi:adenylate cyclase